MIKKMHKKDFKRLTKKTKQKERLYKTQLNPVGAAVPKGGLRRLVPYISL